MIRADSYVYVYFRLDGSPCYVGKGIGDRWLRHFCRTSNPRLRALISAAGGMLPVAKIRTGLTDAEASVVERALIVAIGRGRKGPLVNMTDGGEGTVGFKRTDEQRARLKANWDSAAGQERRRRQSEIARQQMSDPGQIEGLRRRSLGNRYGVGLKRSDQHKAALSAAVAESNRRRVTSDQTRKIRSENMKAMWAAGKLGAR